MNSKKDTPRTSSNPKEVLMKLFSCGAGKKDKLPGSLASAPRDVPEEFEPMEREIKSVQATKVHPPKADEEVELSYTDNKTIGKGTFGVVYKARLCHNSEIVAIKKVFDDKRYKNRELQFLKLLQHPNITNLMYFFYTEDAGCRKGERYLNMVLEYVPETLFSIAKCDGTYTKPFLDHLYIKVYTYQMLRCLNYLHSLNICHRDIKPQNLLINPSNHELKLCDFGSAKELLKNESNVAYICSRYYRAPELIFGAKYYDCQIDMWSAGCVLAELFQGHPIFPGATGPDQMVEIMKVLGTPTYEDIMDINHNISNMRLPPVLAPLPWHKVFTKQTLSYDAIDLISKLLVFSPKKRMSPMEACAHPFFNELRTRGVRLLDGSAFPSLFNFTHEEIERCPMIRERLLPQGWSEDWNSQVDKIPYDNKIHYENDETGIKNKLVKLARTSFRKPSMKKVPHSPGNAIEVRGTDPEIHLDADLGKLAPGARRRMNWMTTDGDVENAIEDASHGIIDLSIKTTPENGSSSKKKKKKRPKQRTGSSEDLGPHDDGDSAEISITSPQIRQKLDFDEFDLEIPVSVSKDEDGIMENLNEKKPRKKKKTKEKMMIEQLNFEDGAGEIVSEEWRSLRNWKSPAIEDGDAVRAVSSSTPADFNEVTETRVVKKKVKQPKSRDNSIHNSFENLDPLDMSSPMGESGRTVAKKKTRAKHVEVHEETGNDIITGGHMVRTVVTTTTSSVEGSRKVKKKSKVKCELEEEV